MKKHSSDWSFLIYLWQWDRDWKAPCFNLEESALMVWGRKSRAGDYPHITPMHITPWRSYFHETNLMDAVTDQEKNNLEWEHKIAMIGFEKTKRNKTIKTIEKWI